MDPASPNGTGVSQAAGESAAPILAVNDISVSRRGFLILQNVSLQVSPADFLTIVGPNGAGKTTLLKCLTGLLVPDTGSVFRAPDLSVGYVPQRLFAGAGMPVSVRDFLTLRRRVDAADVHAIAEETEIVDVLQSPLHGLSGGELQRVLIARALLGSPDVLVLDEPTQNLDVAGQTAFYQLLSRVHENRKLAVVMVSHDVHLVMSATRRVVCLYHHICCQGAPKAVSRDPAFISLLGGDMARLTAVYPHAHDHRHEHD